MALPPRLDRFEYDATATPKPTPPSSISSIPLCFPSPTSVAHVLNQPVAPSHAPPPAGAADPAHNDPAIARRDPKPRPTPSSDHRHAAQGPLLPREQPQPPQPPRNHFYHFPHLADPEPSPPASAVTKSQFVAVLDEFLDKESPIDDATPVVLVARIRRLLDHLDALVEQLSLRVTNSLFDALSHPKCLTLLMVLLSDVSASSSPIVADVRKSYRYPYLIANILANGSMGIRDAFLSSTDLVSHLLSFLDGRVVLSTGPTLPSPSSSSSPSLSPSQPCPPQGQTDPNPKFSYACDNPIIVGNVVQILVSYMETSPEALLKVFLERPTFIPSLVNLLHIGSVPQLLNCLIPDRCVDDLASMDPRTVSFEAPMTLALTVLAGGAVLHHLANAFVEAAQTIYTAATLPLDDGTVDSGQVHRAEQIAFNIVHVYGMVILKSIRAVRLKPDCRACGYLNVFGNANSASTIAGCLQAGIDLFMETHGEESSILKYALELTINLLQCLDKDKERRVASVYGQPQMLETRALEAELDPLLQPLVGVLIDTVETGRGHGQIRIRILEFFVECQSVCSERLVDSFNKARIGEIAMTVMLMNPHNSIMQKIVSRAVESALVTKHRTGGYAHHWLVKSRLIEKIMSTWRRDSGDKAWKDTGLAQKKPYLSALLHMGCCVQHWMAIQREVEEYVPDRNENGGEKAGADPVRKVLVDEVVLEFEEFFKNSMDGIMRMESGHLGGAPPRRRGSRAGGNSFGRSFGSFGTTSASVLRRSGSGMGGTGKGQNRAHLVRSPSAHRFGYVAPVNTVRSELDDMFIEDDLTEGGTFGTTDVGTCFSSMFDVESENSF